MEQRCDLSEMAVIGCHHCVTGARDLGPMPLLLGEEVSFDREE